MICMDVRTASETRMVILPDGTKRMFSVHIIGIPAYLLMLRCPIDVSSIGASPHNSFFCASLNDGLASTKYTASMLFAMGWKFFNVYIIYQQGFPSIDSRLEAYSQHIIHQRPSPRPNLNQLDTLRFAALPHPFGHEPDRYELPEDLRYLGRGYEVSFLAELVAPFLRGHVVSSLIRSQAHSHECCKWNWSSSL